MHDNDLAEYLADDPVPEEAPQPKRSTETERDQFVSDVVRMVMEIFPGARWTTREEYTRASATRDRKGRRRRGYVGFFADTLCRARRQSRGWQGLSL
jgi:hypothetical protein